MERLFIAIDLPDYVRVNEFTLFSSQRRDLRHFYSVVETFPLVNDESSIDQPTAAR
jgi:2'-5' RNA ligase